jgi:uncharacterized protein with PIN domain
MNTNKELKAREILAKQPLDLVGVRDVRKRYKILVDYEKKYKEYSRCPHCGIELTFVYGEVIETYEHDVDDSPYIRNTHTHVDSVRYYCPACNGEISSEVVRILFRKTLKGD